MQASIWLGMEDTLEAIVGYRPWSMLDVGVGFGTWGHLARQYLDVWHGRLARHEWLARIDGIESETDRILPHTRYVYDQIFTGDAQVVLPSRAAAVDYDIILFGDVLEHFPKDDAIALLESAVALARSAVIVRIPLGRGWRTQAERDADSHKSIWWSTDFERFGASVREYDFLGHAYGLADIRTARRSREVEALDARLRQVEAALADVRPEDTAP